MLDSANEREYPEIDIPDEAFIGLFDFFDKWEWHLDTRLTASGRDINPDVLGYIFEQYINDRAAMGAYYTKEDITEYIGRNCILPYLFDKVKNATAESQKAFAPDGYVWRKLRESGDRYIFDAVKKGYQEFAEIPEEISRGLITEEMRKEYSETPIGELPEDHVPLSELRSEWNTRTPERWGLPSEIWRETIDRLQRCGEILGKISRGEITTINDFITYNLDIRTFASDLLAEADNRFVGWFYHALQDVTVLDPTCGSGAFLFAAMNILEPLYEICIERMYELNMKNPKLFAKELEEITAKYRSNIQYFIYKSIILRNLYGVDIMVEATEIAKLRLFLKMVAVVDVDKKAENLGLDPLPDIDFNIRCGNTLVGYATKEQLTKDLNDPQGSMDIMRANDELKGTIEEEMDKVARAYKHFKRIQLRQDEDMVAFKQAKSELRECLMALNDKLNRRLYLASHASSLIPGEDFTKTKSYREWLGSHQPFHWLAEFYEIIEGNGGFDVIIGNPPYVNMNKIPYHISSFSLKCPDLYGHVLIRVQNLNSGTGRQGMIVMHNIGFSRDFKDIRKLLINSTGDYWWSFYSRIPSGLFDGDVRVRNAIYIKANQGSQNQYSTRMHRWFYYQRPTLFQQIEYGRIDVGDTIPMTPIYDVIRRYENLQYSIGHSMMYSEEVLYFKGVGYNWMTLTSEPAYSKGINGEDISYESVSPISIKKVDIPSAILLTCGKYGFVRWMTYGDDFHVTKKDIMNIALPHCLSIVDRERIGALYAEFIKGLSDAYQSKLNAGKIIGSYNIASLWHLTDKSDYLFSKYLYPAWTDENYEKFQTEIVKLAPPVFKE